MAQVADFVGSEPWLLTDEPEATAGIPLGVLHDPYVLAEEPELLAGSQEQLFRINTWMPLPPAAVGFLTIPGEEQEIQLYEIAGVAANLGVIFNALTPEGQYLEPTIGQIWPR